MGPIGAARVGYIGGQYKLNPPLQEMEESTLDLIVAGTADAVLMVESEAKELAEEVMLGAVMFGHKHFQPVIEAIIRLAEKAAKEPRDFKPADAADVEAAVLAIAEKDLREAYKLTRKQDRYAAVDAVKAKVMAELVPAEGEAKFDVEKVKAVFKDVQAKIVRWNILDDGKRIDGRDVRTVRPDRRRGRRAAAHARLGAVHPRRDAGARRRRRWAPARTSSTSTSSKAPARRPSSCTTTSRPIRSARRAAWVRPAAARSATASSPGAPSIRCCRRRTSSPTRCASCRRSPNRTAPPRWRRCAAPRSR